MSSSLSILHQARRAGATAVRAVAPLAAATALHAGLTLDYSAGAAYSNSGWFTGVIDEAVADGQILGNGFKLYGEMSGTDALFWTFSDYWNATVPAYDTTGVAMVWGGRITGATTYDDQLSAPFELTHFFEQTPAGQYDYTYASGVLKLGYSTSPYTPEQWSGGPANNSSGYQEVWFSYYEPGTYDEAGEISVYLEESDAATDLYWFAQLEFQLSHEYAAHWSWTPDEPGANAKLNGDAFRVTVPQNSIDVAYVPAFPTGGGPGGGGVSAIPEPSSLLPLTGLAALSVLVWGQRRRR